MRSNTGKGTGNDSGGDQFGDGFDVLIIGAGAAGMSLALHLPATVSVGLVAKSAPQESNTYLAQGGISAVTASEDSLESHIRDTMRTGAGLCDPKVVAAVVREGPAAISRLQSLGVAFTRKSGKEDLHLGREGGHSHRRIVHMRDRTGAAVHDVLRARVLERPNITVLNDTLAIDLITGWRDAGRASKRGADARAERRDADERASRRDIDARASRRDIDARASGRDIDAHANKHDTDEHTDRCDPDDRADRRDRPAPRRRVCLGAYLFDKARGVVRATAARVTVLATGGAGNVYLYSSNPHSASGDGIAIAWRAGCRVANLEFMQFHPTCLYHPEDRSLLLSEALRGEGARLLLPNGEPFMRRYDQAGELAPRDIVARAIDTEMKKRGLDFVLLDISHKPKAFLLEFFPSLYRRCLKCGYDLAKEPAPVVPAAHYTCGGVMTDLRGRAGLDALHVIGEAAHTGLHGANRIASNSLLECLAFARFAGDAIVARLRRPPRPRPPIPPWDESRVTEADEQIVVAHNWDALRRLMWNYVGIVRTARRLEYARKRLRLMRAEIERHYARYRVSPDLLELRNLALVAELIIRSARRRPESRGLHYMPEHPRPRPEFAGRHTVLTPRRR